MATSNNMSKLLDKIERRLGTKRLNLPQDLQKETWVKAIKEDTLVTFSRYFPHSITVEINQVAKKKGKYWLIDEDIIGKDITILGVRDLDWSEPKNNSVFGVYGTGGYGVSDWYCQPMCLEDMVAMQFAADNTSLFNNGIYIDFESPNKIILKSSFGYDLTHQLNSFYVTLLIQHPISLMTIPPTKMETFESLAIADVANYLYQELKYYDGLETVFASVDMKLDDLRSVADQRADVVQKLEDSYVTFANKNQPMIYTIE